MRYDTINIFAGLVRSELSNLPYGLRLEMSDYLHQYQFTGPV